MGGVRSSRIAHSGKRRVSDQIHWLETTPRRVYLCWSVGVGAMGQKVTKRTVLGIRRKA
jgi:hypothetical protein